MSGHWYAFLSDRLSGPLRKSRGDLSSYQSTARTTGYCSCWLRSSLRLGSAHALLFGKIYVLTQSSALLEDSIHYVDEAVLVVLEAQVYDVLV